MCQNDKFPNYFRIECGEKREPRIAQTDFASVSIQIETSISIMEVKLAAVKM